jgi:hypothetical protein
VFHIDSLAEDREDPRRRSWFKGHSEFFLTHRIHFCTGNVSEDVVVVLLGEERIHLFTRPLHDVDTASGDVKLVPGIEVQQLEEAG